MNPLALSWLDIAMISSSVYVPSCMSFLTLWELYLTINVACTEIILSLLSYLHKSPHPLRVISILIQLIPWRYLGVAWSTLGLASIESIEHSINDVMPSRWTPLVLVTDRNVQTVLGLGTWQLALKAYSIHPKIRLRRSMRQIATLWSRCVVKRLEECYGMK